MAMQSSVQIPIAPFYNLYIECVFLRRDFWKNLVR